MDLTVPAPVETVELPLLHGCVVRDCNVIATICRPTVIIAHPGRCCLSRFVQLWMVWLTGRR